MLIKKAHEQKKNIYIINVKVVANFIETFYFLKIINISEYLKHGISLYIQQVSIYWLPISLQLNLLLGFYIWFMKYILKNIVF